MVRNDEIYQQALNLRARGFTLAEIAKVCGVAKSTVSLWLKGDEVSARVTEDNKRRVGVDNAKRLRLMAKARSSERATRYQEAERSAETEFRHYRTDLLFMAGLMLYSAHGTPPDVSKVRFSSSDAAAHAIFLRFLEEYAGTDRSTVRTWLQLYPAHTSSVCEVYWLQKLSLTPEQLLKTQIMKSAVSTPLHNGVGNTIISRTVLARKLAVWVTLAQQELLQEPKQ